MNGISHNILRIRCRPTRWHVPRGLLAPLIVSLLLSLVAVLNACAQTPSPNEYQVKAAFLFNFMKFIDWPAVAYTSPQSPFAICILGKDPFGSLLDDALLGKTMDNHPVAVRRLKDIADARHCQVVFVSSSETKKYAEIVDSVRGANILLVGETGGFAAAGGTIEFILEESHVRFAINPDAAERAGLRCSSKLLALAKIIHDEGYSKGG